MTDSSSRTTLPETCFQHTDAPMLVLEASGTGCHIVQANAACAQWLGREPAELAGQPWPAVLGEAGAFDGLQAALDRGEPASCSGLLDGPEGQARHCRVSIQPVPARADRSARWVLTLHDLTAQVAAEQAREFLASHEAVSGLLRPELVKDNLAAELLRAINHCHRLFVCYIDIDKFGAVNETDGFEAGDRLIRLVAERLAAGAARPLVSRIGGDEFIVGGVDLDGDLDLLEVGQALLDALREPLALGAYQVRLGASVGIACFPDTAASVPDLVQQASLAARTAKERGGNRVHVFDTRQRARLKDRVDIGLHLRGAVARGELELNYQPVVSVGKRAISGMEALLRWRSPELGLVSPDRFIPMAEQLGLITDIGQWVLVQACQQARRWLDCGVADFVLSVNVSGLQMRGQRVIEDVSRALDAARLPARYLELELTERAIMGDPHHVAALMQELRKIGVALAMDDFGIGHSSLGLMQRFPVNRLKIDRSFVSAVPNDVGAARICRAILGLAHEFGCTVVAEGVETPLQLGFLERNGCEFVQGNYLGEPVTAEGMLARLRSPALGAGGNGDRGHAGSVLLVDDEQNVLRALARLLRRDGYAIHTAGTFQQAFEILGTAEIDVVVSDHRMPEGRGTAFLGKVKETHPGTVRMILSGYADIGAVTEAINGGAVYRFLTKPWVDDDLRKVIRDAVARARRSTAGRGEGVGDEA